MTPRKTAFRKNLRFWSLHCSLTALPSFLIAGIYLDFFQSIITALPMVVGVLIFILSYTLLSTFSPLLNNQESRFSRALRLALKIRIGVSILGLLGVALPFIFFYHPDYWAGMGAKFLIEKGYDLIWPHAYGFGHDLTSTDHFLAILLWTLTEGIILSFLLFSLSFFCLDTIDARQNHKLSTEE